MSLTQLLLSALVLALLVWRLQARWKNFVGRQRFSPKKLTSFLTIFGVAAVVIAVLALPHHRALGMFASGLAIGGALSFVGLRLTRFEFTPHGTYFTPNTHIGVALTLLLGVQFIYRRIALYFDPKFPGPPPSFFDNWPVFVMLGITAGYFIAYNAGVLRRGKRKPEA